MHCERPIHFLFPCLSGTSFLFFVIPRLFLNVLPGFHNSILDGIHIGRKNIWGFRGSSFTNGNNGRLYRDTFVYDIRLAARAKRFHVIKRVGLLISPFMGEP